MKKFYSAALLLVGLYLGLHNGYLALWRTGETKPEHVFPYRAAVYPKIDQIALQNGIPINNNDTLDKLLEDFLS